ncbi:helix-turn-helix domain-containing protein [Streptomyces sp. NPDC002054]|uniref:helix-turn-helix domain-containing protein n=1 Tax=Streptomyces sp. NPDC002054 TaxID=3154663 RepID=UPI003333EFC2
MTDPHNVQYTVVGNHLAQHTELSLIAIGLATHIQSLPDGSPVGIKHLSRRFPEGAQRIAAALRELEAHGYLSRTRERLPNGQVVTRTVSYNRPQGVKDPDPEDEGPEPDPEPDPPRGGGSRRRRRKAAAVPAPAKQAAPPPEPPRAPAKVVPLPRPDRPSAGLHRAAVDLLAGLRTEDPRLLLAERDVQRLAPAVAAWLEREAAPEAVTRALAALLPPDLRYPAAMLAYRLKQLLPPPLPEVPEVPKPPRPDPFQTCDGCERAFRAPEPGRCRDCPPDGQPMPDAA